MEIKYLIIVFGLIVGSIYKPIIAATYYVNDNSTANDIYCSAVGAAGNTGLTPNSPKATIAQVIALTGAGSHTIYIDNGTYAEVNINLSGENLIILGAGVERTIFNNLNANAVFTTNPTSAYTITFQDLSIKNYSSTTTGVGILFTPTNSSTLNLNNVVVSGCNILTPPGSSGRGPILVSGSLNIKGGGFFCNGSASSPGGAIEIASTGGGTVSIFGTAFIGNTKTNQSNQMPYGAAICIGNVTNAAAANISISDCLFDGNTIATGSGTNGQGGSAIFINNNIANTVTIKNCIIKNGNVASNQSGFGVACNFYRGVINVSKTLFDNNTITSGATNEGAVGVQFANVVLDTCKFSNNTAATYSDVTLTQAGASVTATNCTFSSVATNLFRTATGTFTIDRCGNPSRAGSFTVLNTTAPIAFSDPSLVSWTGSCGSGYSLTSGGPVVVNASSATIGPSYYDNLRLAFLAVNNGTHKGVITMTIYDHLFDDNTAILNASGTGSGSYSSISITPSGSWQVLGSIAAGSPQLDFNGADNVTLDGLNSGGNSLLISNSSNSSTAGTSTIRFINDASSNTITNCTIEGSETSVSSGVIFLSNTTNTTGNDNNTVSNCLIFNDASGNPFNLVYSGGTASKSNSGCSIINCGLSNYTRNGIFLDLNSDSWTISGNSFYNTAASSTITSSNTAVNIASTANLTSATINSNYIGGRSASCGGSAYTLTTSTMGATLRGISVASSGGNVTINSNVIQNISFSQTGNASGINGIRAIETNGTSVFTIGQSGASNLIGAMSGTASISCSGGFQADVILISCSGNANNYIGYNNIGAISQVATAGNLYLISITGTGMPTITNNVLGSTVANNIFSSSAGSNYGIYTFNTGTYKIYLNTIQNFNLTNVGGSVFYGIYSGSSPATGCAVDCRNNIIKNVVHLGTGSFVPLFVNLASGTSNIVSYNTIGGNPGDTLRTNASGTQQGIYINIPSSAAAGSVSTRCTGNIINRTKLTNGYYGIYYQVSSVGSITTTTANIDSNQINTISSANFEAIQVYCARATNTVSCNNNTIGGTSPYSISPTGTVIYGINFDPSGVSTCTFIANNNYVSNLNPTNSGGLFVVFQGADGSITSDNNTILDITSACSFRGYSINGSATSVITNNSITNVTATAGYMNAIYSDATTTNTVTGNTINDINLSSSSTTIPLFTAISTAGNGTLTLGSSANPNIIGSTTDVASPSDGITITVNTANSGAQGSLSIIKVNGATNPKNVSYNQVGGIKINGTNTSGIISLVDVSGSTSPTINNNTFGNAVPNNIDIIANMEQRLINSPSTSLSILSNVFQNFRITSTNKNFTGVYNNLTSTVLTCNSNIFSRFNSSSSGSFYLFEHGLPGSGNDSRVSCTINNNSADNFTISAASTVNFFYVNSRCGSGLSFTINSNTIGNSTANNILISSNASVYGINFYGGDAQGVPGGSMTCNSNTFQNFNLTSTGSSSFFNGIYFYPWIAGASNDIALTFSGNTIKNISSNSTYISRPSLCGVYFNSDIGIPASSNLISDNTFDNFTLNPGSANATIAGFYYNLGMAGFTFSGNHIYNFSNSSSGGSGAIYGVYDVRNAASGYSSRFINNAIIISNGSNTNSIIIQGINVNYNNLSDAIRSPGPHIYHNTIKIAGSMSAGSNRTFCLNAVPINNSCGFAINNIFQNLRSGGIGGHYALGNPSNKMNVLNYNYLEVSENINKLYNNGVDQANAPGAQDIRNRGISLDVMGNVPTATIADVRNNGINTLGITTDIDGAPRATGSVVIPCGSCNGPWRGAYENFWPLSIELLEMSVRCTNSSNQIDWQTSSETNNEKFQIFHSLDGESFKVIGGIKGAGNSTEIKNYSFQHKEAPLGKNYYKLRQIDFDGNYTDSKVVVFDGRCANLNFNTESIYYNAENNMLNLTLNSLVDERGCFSLLDVSGRIIFKESFNINKHTDLYTFSMPLLSNGVYLVTLSDDGGGQYSQKIVINR